MLARRRAVATSARSPKTYTDLRAGQTHTFEVQATKPHLLVDADAGDVRVDDRRRRPRRTRRSRPARPPTTDLTDATFEFTGADDGTPAADLDFECALDGAAFAPCASPEEYTDLAVGDAHARGPRDRPRRQRRPDARPCTSWTVVEPTTIDSGPAGPSASPQRDVHVLRPTTRGASFECSLDGADFAACASPHDGRAASRTASTRSRSAPSTAFGVWDETPAEHAWTVALPPGAGDDDRRRRRTRSTRRPSATLRRSPPTRPARRSSARSTAPRSRPARRRASTPAWPAARTASRCARSSADGIRRRVAGAPRLDVDLPPETTIDSGPAAVDREHDARTFDLLLQRARPRRSSARSTAPRSAPARRRRVHAAGGRRARAAGAREGRASAASTPTPAALRVDGRAAARDDDRLRLRTTRPRARRRRSSSPPTAPARRSSAGWTTSPGSRRASRRRRTPPSPTASTSSSCAPRTPPATSTRRRPSTAGRSARSRRR